MVMVVASTIADRWQVESRTSRDRGAPADGGVPADGGAPAPGAGPDRARTGTVSRSVLSRPHRARPATDAAAEADLAVTPTGRP